MVLFERCLACLAPQRVKSAETEQGRAAEEPCAERGQEAAEPVTAKEIVAT